MAEEWWKVLVPEVVVPVRKDLLGTERRILFYVQPDGTVPAREFLERKCNQVKYSVRFKKLATLGPHKMRGDEHHGLFENGDETLRGTYSIKDIGGKTRIFYASDRGGLVILLCGARKKEDRLKKKEVNMIKRMYEEYRNRRDLFLSAGETR